jgi:cyclopropane-fatty-acyl-phospholipid synthase
MAEHVGAQNLPAYAEQMRRLLRPGGRLLHHQITSPHLAGRSARRQFIDRYVFPDGELRPVGEVVGYLESAGFEAWDVEALREHYILTLRAWLENLEHNWNTASALTSPARARTWRLYLAGSAAAFATGRIGVHQVLAVAPLPGGAPAMPRLRSAWLPG